MQRAVEKQIESHGVSNDFVARNRTQYGVLGSNNRVAADLERPPLPNRCQRFTREDHFKFGFDGEEFGGRISSAAKYWVEYGAPERGHRGFEVELTAALEEIRDDVGTFSVSASCSYIISAVAAISQRCRWQMSQVVVDIEGFRPVLFDDRIPVQRVLVSWESFAKYALEFATVAGCSDAWLALEAFHGAVSKVTHIYDGAEIRILNNNFDEPSKTIVGPPDWTLVDNEKYTAIDRYLIAQRRRGVTQILRWSPELIAAQIDSPQTRNWLRRASHVRVSSNGSGWLNQRARIQMVTAAFPKLGVAPDNRRSRGDSELEGRMTGLSKRMRNLSPDCQSQHRYPLLRLFRKLGLNCGFLAEKHPLWYGSVHEQQDKA